MSSDTIMQFYFPFASPDIPAIPFAFLTVTEH